VCDFGNLSNWQRREYPTAPVIPRLANPVAERCELLVIAIVRRLQQQTAWLTIASFPKARQYNNVEKSHADKMADVIFQAFTRQGRHYVYTDLLRGYLKMNWIWRYERLWEAQYHFIFTAGIHGLAATATG
jgi:hypothetical protein